MYVYRLNKTDEWNDVANITIVSAGLHGKSDMKICSDLHKI